MKKLRHHIRRIAKILGLMMIGMTAFAAGPELTFRKDEHIVGREKPTTEQMLEKRDQDEKDGPENEITMVFEESYFGAVIEKFDTKNVTNPEQ